MLMLCPIVTDRMCSVVVEQLWELTGSDRMLESYVQSWHCAASGHHLTVEIKRLRLNGGNTWRASVDQMLGESGRA